MRYFIAYSTLHSFLCAHSGVNRWGWRWRKKTTYRIRKSLYCALEKGNTRKRRILYTTKTTVCGLTFNITLFTIFEYYSYRSNIMIFDHESCLFISHFDGRFSMSKWYFSSFSYTSWWWILNCILSLHWIFVASVNLIAIVIVVTEYDFWVTLVLSYSKSFFFQQ